MNRALRLFFRLIVCWGNRRLFWDRGWLRFIFRLWRRIRWDIRGFWGNIKLFLVLFVERFFFIFIVLFNIRKLP